jgi:hypothetical protein
MTQMWTIVVQDLGDTIADVIGPFWEETSAEGFARRNVSRLGYRWTVKPMRERGEWLAEAEENWRRGR